jgi:hypothetical protein
MGRLRFPHTHLCVSIWLCLFGPFTATLAIILFSFLLMAATMPPPPTPSQWNPHPTLYRKPFYVVFAVRDSCLKFWPETDRSFQVEDTTFGLDVGGLVQHSVPLGDILQVETTIPRSEGTESNPIVVHGVTVQRFESFMTWLNHLLAPSFNTAYFLITFL